MKAFLSLLLITLSILLCGCPVASSRIYQPLEWEKPYLAQFEKCVMPSDVQAHPASYTGKRLHWVGIIDTLIVNPRGESMYTSLLVNQKYYDYIEDFGIQRERMFVSPYGEGAFYFDKIFVGSSMDSLKPMFLSVAKKGNLVFCYGTFTTLRDSIPVLVSSGARFIPSELFATDIFSYRVERDSLGKIVAGKDGFPKLTDIKILRIS
jgi:hypothetical protein